MLLESHTVNVTRSAGLLETINPSWCSFFTLDVKFSCSVQAHISLSCTFGLTIQNGWCLQSCEGEIFIEGFSLRKTLWRFSSVSVRDLFLKIATFLLISPVFPLITVVMSSLWRNVWICLLMSWRMFCATFLLSSSFLCVWCSLAALFASRHLFFFSGCRAPCFSSLALSVWSSVFYLAGVF